MKKRNYLKNSAILCRVSGKEGEMREFSVLRKLSEGSSSVCYEADRENKLRGVLKEFYPTDGGYGLKRDEQGLLIPSARGEADFLMAVLAYMKSYITLLAARERNKDLAAFIPAIEIYRGCDEEGNIVGTVYIWTPEPELETFDKICDQIHKHPAKDPEKKLFMVLNSVKLLTECVSALHRENLIHRDINPSNFGLAKRGNRVLTGELSIFDVDSICPAGEHFDGRVGTDGYREPEIETEGADPKTDVYSIGATLFHAIVLTEETKKNGYLFCGEDYDRLHELVNESKLIRASEENSHPRLRDILSIILQKCLCSREHRYADCGELLEDLKKALYYALPSDIARTNRKNSALAIKYRLYEQPLYKYIADNGKSINVLVIGFGNYGQKFVDACLQAGQIRDRQLKITVVSDAARDKEIYLSDRPELPKFFSIDGSSEIGDAYGSISFVTGSLGRTDHKENAAILENILCVHFENECPSYIFIALGDDELNHSAAVSCNNVIRTLFESKCVINYVVENDRHSQLIDPALCPLYVNADITKTALYHEIERMAFNTHLIWEKSLNLDYRAVRENFRKDYNHDSSVSSVLSLKYKLHCLGIDPDECGFEAAAKLVIEKLGLEPETLEKRPSESERARLNRLESMKAARNELIWLEHRRWVTEKICLGWRAISVDKCDGVTKDERNKRHICILKSRPDQKLAEEFTAKDWASESNADLSVLDPLDRMSVELYRYYAKKARVVSSQDLFGGSIMTEIRSRIENNKKCLAAFQEWIACMKEILNEEIMLEEMVKEDNKNNGILNGMNDKVRFYKGLRNAFLESADLLTRHKKAIRQQVKVLDDVFYPVIASLEHHDWKQEDVNLIDNIPFILTYSEDICMVIPFSAGDNSNAFDNVAAPLAVNPERILYLCLVDDSTDIVKLKDSIRYVMNCMQKKRLKAAVEFIVIYTAGEEDTAAKINENFCAKTDKRIRQVRHFRFEDVTTELKDYLLGRSKGKRIFALEKNSTGLSRYLQGIGSYNVFRQYHFSTKHMAFSEGDIFRNIKKLPYITVADMAAFKGASSNSGNQPEFFQDHKRLWKLYRKNPGSWKALCNILKDKAQTADVLACFDIPPAKGDLSEYRYLLPLSCGKSVTKILNFMEKDFELIDESSSVSGYTSEMCEVTIYDYGMHESAFACLFTKLYALADSSSVTLRENKDKSNHEIVVSYDNLTVSGVRIDKGKKDVLDGLRDMNFLIGLEYTDDGYTASFTYASKKIKELLTTAGKILEVHTYHKIRELGSFDDVVCGFEVDWKEGLGVKNEFDCVATKGFRSLFIECKAKGEIDQDTYHKLDDLAKYFGVHPTIVLISDTQETHEINSFNEMNRSRGNMLKVVTVWDPNEINNIGHTLLAIIRGNYKTGDE